MKKINLPFILLLLVTGITNLHVQLFGIEKGAEISGVIFEDSNHNLEFDKGEKGIPGILVSNQNEIVKTNSKGQYTLPVRGDETIIYVIKPAGYNTPLDENNLPQFFYIHKSKGSTGLKYRGIEPTGDLPERLNFPLYKAFTKDTFQVLALADPQTKTLEEVDYFRDDIVAELVGTEAIFGIALGDIMFDDLSLFEPYNATLSMAGIPIYNVPGNHDFDHYPNSNIYSLETFKQHYGPHYYAFEYGKVSFVVLNSVIYMKDDPGGYGHYRGGIDTIQLKWLKNYLEFVPEEQLIVFCMHVPFHSLNSDEPQEFIANRSSVFNLVKDRKNVLAINGHLHALENLSIDESIGWASPVRFQQISCATASGSWWSGPKDERGIPVSVQLKDGTPNGYHIFTFEGNTFNQKFKAANKNSDYQIRISSPVGTIPVDELDSTMVVANFFNGNDLSTVSYTVDNSGPFVMKKTRMKDPYTEKLYDENVQLYREWMSVDYSNHIWTGKLPAGLAMGMHKIIVNAKNEYGIEYSQAVIFEIK